MGPSNPIILAIPLQLRHPPMAPVTLITFPFTLRPLQTDGGPHPERISGPSFCSSHYIHSAHWLWDGRL